MEYLQEQDPIKNKDAVLPLSEQRNNVIGERLLVEEMTYLMRQDPEQDKDAVLLLSEHFRTRFGGSDHSDDQTANPAKRKP